MAMYLHKSLGKDPTTGEEVPVWSVIRGDDNYGPYFMEETALAAMKEMDEMDGAKTKTDNDE